MRGASEKEPCSKGPTAHPPKTHKDTGVQQQHLLPRPGPGAPQGCYHLPAPCCWLYSQFHLNTGPEKKKKILGLVLRASDTRPVISPLLVSPSCSCPAPQSGLPTSQQSQHLNNGAVWLQALILHRLG